MGRRARRVQSRCGSRSRPAPTTSSATRAIRRAVAPIGVATGEHGMNRVLFKQMFQAEAIDYCQLDSCRLGSVNEILAVLSSWRRSSAYRCARTRAASGCASSSSTCQSSTSSPSRGAGRRVTEFVDHLHEHFTDPCVVATALRPARGPGYSARMRRLAGRVQLSGWNLLGFASRAVDRAVGASVIEGRDRVGRQPLGRSRVWVPAWMTVRNGSSTLCTYPGR